MTTTTAPPATTRTRPTLTPVLLALLALLSAFTIAFGAGQIFYGPAGDRFGRRPVILSGLFIYVLGSIGCAFAAEAGHLIVLRLLQGLAACGSVVLART